MNSSISRRGPHVRSPWGERGPNHVYIHCTLDQMRGQYKKSQAEAKRLLERYERAKRHYSTADASDIVDEWVNEAILDRLVDDLLEVNMPPIVVLPHPEFDEGRVHDAASATPTNAIPFALADRISAVLDCPVDEEIVEVARPGRTRLSTFPRFLWQPQFEGEVRPDRAYILVDDVCTLAGTFAMLRSHIVSQGGTVLAATALAHGNGGTQPFPIEQRTLNVLSSYYGSQGLNDLWIEVVGHGIRCLTQAEGLRLAAWSERSLDGRRDAAALHFLRDRFLEAAGQAR